jgi:hypothetical protein
MFRLRNSSSSVASGEITAAAPSWNRAPPKALRKRLIIWQLERRRSLLLPARHRRP